MPNASQAMPETPDPVASPAGAEAPKGVFVSFPDSPFQLYQP